MEPTALDRDRLQLVKLAYTTRAVRPEAMTTLLPGAARPRAGDLVLARVDALGQHKRLELPDGRRATLLVGDEVVVCYAPRYAPDQFEAEVPDDLAPCHLVAGGGIAARMVAKHSAMGSPTAVTPVGLVADDRGRRINLRDWALAPTRLVGRRPPTIGVVGTSMNAGKTTAVADLVRGLRLAGRTVGAAKVTGTGSGGDAWLFVDAGATPALDFTLAGHPSTYQLPLEDVVAVLGTLTAQLAGAGCDAIVLEVADGLLQSETAALLRHPAFAATVDTLVFAACDAVGAIGGVSLLAAAGHDVAAVAGALTASPLAVQEASALLACPVLDREELQDPDRAERLLVDRRLQAVRVAG